MDYKKLMGYEKKKKVVKKQPKPKVNKVIESIKEEFGLIKEVGAATEYRKYQKNIEKDLDRLTDTVRELKNFLMKNGNQQTAKEVGSIYASRVGKFHHWMKTKWVRIVRKII